MKHFEKIKQIRQDLNLTIAEAYQRGVAILGPHKAISTSTMNRIEAGKPNKFSSLRKYCFILGIELTELLKGTEWEERLVISRKDRTEGYMYNEKASSYIVNNPHQSFLAQEFILFPSGRTTLDHAPINHGKFEKWAYVVQGQVCCFIGEEKFLLKRGDTLSFDSTKPHYFENISRKKCIFTIVENPGRY